MEKFKVKKVKLLDSLGVDITYYESVTREDGEYWVEKKIKSTIQRHPDLDKVVSEFNIHLVRIFELLALGMYKPESDMTEHEKKFLKSVLRKVEVVCVSFTGNDEQSEGVMIQGRKEVFDGKVAVLTTPNLLFNGSYDYASEVCGLAKKLSKEVFDYIYKKKYAQLNLFTENMVV